MDYESFMRAKSKTIAPAGFAGARNLPPMLFGYQREAVEWALALGRAALFFDCGLGKTPMQVAWAQAVHEHTGKPVLVLAPLAVAQQTVREGAKFGVRVEYCSEQAEVTGGVVITNYERLPRFDASAFAGVVLDESSILKSFSGTTKKALVESFAETPYRLCCSATPAPNDHIELGNHAEFLGVLSSHEMLARWFLNDTEHTGHYRLKGYAIAPFWDWVTSWARCAGKPSDVGHDDAGFVLPELHVHEHVVDADMVENRGENLFRIPDMSATSFHAEKRLTAASRAKQLASLVEREPGEQWLIWSDTDYEADELVAALPDAVDVRGSQSQSAKERALLDFADGKIRTLITKPKLAGLGMNFQNCARIAFIGPSFSYEQYYQAVRRVWRFGQSRPVHAHVFLAQTELGVWSVVRRKAADHENMKREMFAAAKRAQSRTSATREYSATCAAPLPAWIHSAV